MRVLPFKDFCRASKLRWKAKNLGDCENALANIFAALASRSEERRVGKECRL